MRQKEVMRVRQLRFFYRFVQFVLVVVAAGMGDVNIHDLILSNGTCYHVRKPNECQIKANAPQFGAPSSNLAGEEDIFQLFEDDDTVQIERDTQEMRDLLSE